MLHLLSYNLSGCNVGKNCDAKSHLLPRLDVINKMHEMRRKTEPNSIFTKITLKVNLISHRMQHNAFFGSQKLLFTQD